MKLKRNLFLALLGAFFIHIFFFAMYLLVSLVRTFFYQPQFAPNDVVLQSDVTFGLIARDSPFLLLSSYLLVTLLLYALLNTSKWIKRKVG